jgi:hypothetical protein
MNYRPAPLPPLRARALEELVEAAYASYEHMGAEFEPFGFDYKRVSVDGSTETTLLSELGKDRWHVVHVSERPNRRLFLFLERWYKPKK